jgi:hypothetical protein
MFGVMVTVILLCSLWMARGKLDGLGLEFIRWKPTPAKPILLGSWSGSRCWAYGFAGCSETTKWVLNQRSPKSGWVSRLVRCLRRSYSEGISLEC